MLHKNNVKQQVWKLFYGKGRSSALFNAILFSLVFVVIFLFVLSSIFPTNTYLKWLEFLLGIVFLCEYVARTWVAPNKMRYLLTPLSIVDIIVVLSLLVPAFTGHLGFLRVIRSFQILRVYSLTNTHLSANKHSFWNTHKDLIQGATNLVLFIFLMSSLVLSLQQNMNEHITSYVDALYFTMATLTTTGFGDVTLVGTPGKLLSSVMMILGVTLFVQFIRSTLSPAKIRYRCKYCGLRTHERDASHCKHCGHTIKNDSALL